NPNADESEQSVELARSTDEEKQRQITHLNDFHMRHQPEAEAALARVQQAGIAGENIFSELMHAVRVCSLGQLSDVLYEAGGQYRRNM
ncbi:MAG: methylmalonyl-CoA mutase, partial [Proteobacteria bacterium]|nr:methylmalonyl-CoA mutase [Pseudomonadota bacterium]